MLRTSDDINKIKNTLSKMGLDPNTFEIQLNNQKGPVFSVLKDNDRNILDASASESRRLSPEELGFILSHEYEHTKQPPITEDFGPLYGQNPPKAAGVESMLPWTIRGREQEADYGGQQRVLSQGISPSFFAQRNKNLFPEEQYIPGRNMGLYATHPSLEDRAAHLKARMARPDILSLIIGRQSVNKSL